jgi:hypothetical protein
MSDITPLERAVLGSILDRWPDLRPALEQQLATARVTKRENSGAGFFTTLAVDPTTPAIQGRPDSVDAEVDGLAHGMGFVLFVDGAGHADLLEGYTYGEREDTSGLDLHNLIFELKPEQSAPPTTHDGRCRDDH